MMRRTFSASLRFYLPTGSNGEEIETDEKRGNHHDS